MAGKIPNKPVAGRSRGRKPVSAVVSAPSVAPVPVVPPEPIVEAPVAHTEVSTVALASVAAPVVAVPEPVELPAAVEAPAEPVAAAAPTFETHAEAPGTPMPESMADAVSAPVVDNPAVPAATQTQTVEPAPVPAAENKKDTAMDTVETTAVKAETMFADMNSRAKTAMEKSQKLAQEMGDLQKGNVEAVVESAKIYAKGVEAMGQEAADYGRRSFEQMTAALKSMAQVKTPAELLKLHADFVRSSFDAAVAEGSKTTEAVIKLASDVAQPMSNRFALVAEKVKAAA